MGRLRFVFPLSMLISSLALAACGSKNQTPLAEKQSSVAKTDESAKPPNPWDDWLIIQGSNYIPVVDELGRNIRRARQEFLEVRFQAAAADVRKGADFLRQEIGPASPTDKAKLSAVIKEMEELADSLDKNSVTSLEALDRVFVRAHQVDLENSWAVVGVEKWFPFIESTGQHLRSAREAFLRNDHVTAATEIRKAEALLRLQASRSTTQGKADLEAAWNELEALAVRIETGSVPQVQVLSNTFAASQYALARVHDQMALQEWTDKERVKTGYELKAAIMHLEKGDSWAGRGTRSDLVRQAQLVSKELIDGRAIARKNVNKEIENIGKVIENHDKKAELALK
jgi:hypothetical protein